MDGATLTTASGILKEAYEGTVVSQLGKASPLWAQIEKGSEDIVQGRYAVMSLRFRPSQGIGARAEGGVIPKPGAAAAVQTQVLLKYLYGALQMSGPLIEAAKSDKGAFIRALRNEVESMQEGLKRDMSRQLYGDGSGQVALCDTTTASDTVVLDADANMQYFEVGMRVDIRVITTGAAITDGDSREIIAVDRTNKTIQLDGGTVVTTSNLHGVFREDARNNEILGLGAIVDDDSVLHGVDPTDAGNERWASHVKGSFGAFSIAKLQTELDLAEDNSGDWVTHLVSNGTVRNFYLSTLTAERRFAAQENPKKLNGGFTGLAYTGGEVEAVWMKDKFSPAGKLWGLCLQENRLKLRRAKDFEFIKIGDSAWIPDIMGASGTDSYKAVMASYCELTTNKRNAHVRLDAVTAPA